MSLGMGDVAQTTHAPVSSTPGRRRVRVWRWATPTALAALVAVVGATTTGALTWATWVSDRGNEQRLLTVQTRQAAAVLAGTILTIQDPLVTSLRICAATGGDRQQFVDVMGPEVGTGRVFVSVQLLQIVEGGTRTLVRLGADPLLDPGSAQQLKLLARAGRSRTFAVEPVGDARIERVAYAAVDQSTGWVVYAERAIPPDRLVPAVSTPAFANLDFATYIGDPQDSAGLATTNRPLAELPLRGLTARESVPFGDTVLTLVARPSRSLSGAAAERLPWIVLVVGLVLSALTAVAAFRSLRQRLRAERDATTIRDLYTTLDVLYREQRGIAETLQHALLPHSNPVIEGVEFGTRYVAGARGVDIGGDWYSVVALDEGRFAFVIGDVSGRGVGAAAVMARLRFTLRAYLVEGHPPGRALEMTNLQIDLADDGHFATCLVGIADPRSGQVQLANAGHLEPLLVHAGTATYVPTSVGAPLGVALSAYPTTTVTVPDGAVLLLFTDGLVERRQESIDDGLDRLAAAAGGVDDVLDDYVTRLITHLTGLSAEDDLAVLAIRRTAPTAQDEDEGEGEEEATHLAAQGVGSEG